MVFIILILDKCLGTENLWAAVQCLPIGVAGSFTDANRPILLYNLVMASVQLPWMTHHDKILRVFLVNSKRSSSVTLRLMCPMMRRGKLIDCGC